MTNPILEIIATSISYTDLPEMWRVRDIERFSPKKTLYGYQTDALENAARALYLYYGTDAQWTPTEPQGTNGRRKLNFASLYQRHGNMAPQPSVRKYETQGDRRREKQNHIFRILSDFSGENAMEAGDEIPFWHNINRMCFWMATGSGKTLVMVKLIEYLHLLKRFKKIPPHNLLILAPSNHLINQIRQAIEAFNQMRGLNIELVPLRAINHSPQNRLGVGAVVYYHRSDTISDVQKEALTDYRNYENGGKWYVLLDEAHKGGKEDSKRQAYYTVMARSGFLFNFSATFSESQDVITTVKKYNLEEFINNGHGKNIYLNQNEYKAFHNREGEISGVEKQIIVLKSLITFAYVKRFVQKMRQDTGLASLYHLP